eukprot:2470786-Rhodomonas_salina.1
MWQQTVADMVSAQGVWWRGRVVPLSEITVCGELLCEAGMGYEPRKPVGNDEGEEDYVGWPYSPMGSKEEERKKEQKKEEQRAGGQHATWEGLLGASLGGKPGSFRGVC